MTSKIRRQSRFSCRGRDSSGPRRRYFAKALGRQGFQRKGAGNAPVPKPLKVQISTLAADLSKVHCSLFATWYILFKFQLASQRGKNVASEFRLLRTSGANLTMHSCSERQAAGGCVFRCKYQKLLILPTLNKYFGYNFKVIFSSMAGIRLFHSVAFAVGIRSLDSVEYCSVRPIWVST